MSTTFKSADLVAMDRTVRAGFSQAFSAKEGYIPWTPRIAAMETSSSAANLYPFGIDSGNFREWAEGERHVNSVGVGSVAVTNVKRELTYGVKREMIDDDMTGALRGVVGRVRSAAGKLRRLPDRLMAALLNANPTSLSGSTLFNGSHVIPGTARTFDNDFGSTSLTRDNAVAMRSAMLGIRGSDDDIINTDPRILLVPSELEDVAIEIAYGSLKVKAGTSTTNISTVLGNSAMGLFEVVVAPQLSQYSATTWYLVDASDPYDRGLIHQTREAAELVAKFSPEDPEVFMRDEYIWGLRERSAVAAGNPVHIARGTA